MRNLLNLIFLILIFTSCESHKLIDRRLEKVNGLAADSPIIALKILESIDKNELNNYNRHFYDLMTIKAQDKAWINITNDSLILKVKNYFSKDKESWEYIESTYYCGRTYCMIGDYPSAMQYFQEIIERTNKKKDKKYLELRGTTLAQLDQILSSLNLLNERIPNLMELIKIDQLRKDTFNIIYDYVYLGQLYIEKKQYEKAKEWLLKGKKYFNGFGTAEASINMYLAAIKYYEGNNEEALALLRPNIERLDTFSYSAGLNYLTNIFFDMEQYDSSFYYAKKLIEKGDEVNTKNGYHIILAPELKDYLNKDTLFEYIYSYRELLNRDLERNTQRQALLQNNLYNYSIHNRERQKAEKDKDKFSVWLFTSIIVCLIAVILYLFQCLKNRKQKEELYKALMVISNLNREIDKNKKIIQDNRNPVTDNKLNSTPYDNKIIVDDHILEEKDFTTQKVSSLRNELQRELEELFLKAPQVYHIPEKLYESAVYKILQDKIRNNKSLANDSAFWNELEAAVERSSKQFMRRLSILLGGKITENDRQVALLIKCGVSPTAMKILLCRTPGTISYRRTSLGIKAFDKKMSVQDVDRLITLL